ncbi:MAG: RNA polymerase sigma factor [Bacteroidales bacterium]|nr:RNA polymerase sigma factor [Bacteroidales bacterium]
MEPYNDLEIIRGIRERDNNILEYLYNEYFGMIYDFVYQNNGSEDDARDVLQEAIILIYKKIRNESLELNSSFKIYFYSVCQRIWFHELRSRKIEYNHILNYAIPDSEFVDSVNEEYKQQKKYRLYQEHFNKLSIECKKVLRMFLRNCSLKHIAKMMQYKSQEYAKKRKFICKEQLVKSIKNDKRFNKLL